MFAILGAIASIGRIFMPEQQLRPVEEVKENIEVEITDLVIYPCRGVQGIHLSEVKVGVSGFELDREWCLLQKDISRKDMRRHGRRWVSITRNVEVPKISCRFENKYLVFSNPKQAEDLWIDTEKEPSQDTYTFNNFEGENLEGYSEGEEASKWFSEIIGLDVVLVRSKQEVKSSSHKYEFYYDRKDTDIRKPSHIHAAIHVINERSVERLNSKIKDESLHVNSEPFRPNIVISGIRSDEEDDLREVQLTSDGTTFRMIKHCVRCKTPTYNKEIGKMNPSGEPFTTLRTYKTHPEIGTIFGIFLQADRDCTIRGK